ncbi:hypothetical protein F959_00401, partial [Acinetobacter venetianus RAG-1 = CIP 110063]
AMVRHRLDDLEMKGECDVKQN